MICAPHFKMATESQKEELQERIKNEYDEKLKAIITEEEAAKEAEAIDQAAKKGGKPPPKKDPKKA